jgi:hypothetical protein
VSARRAVVPGHPDPGRTAGGKLIEEITVAIPVERSRDDEVRSKDKDRRRSIR